MRGYKAMPYILHLPKVNVTSAGEIQSPDGTDVRILLRRLATRLTLSWKNESEKTGYTLEQVLLQSIPVDYRLLKPVNDDTYRPCWINIPPYRWQASRTREAIPAGFPPSYAGRAPTPPPLITARSERPRRAAPTLPSSLATRATAATKRIAGRN